jgi:hypothetical protein
VWTLCVQGMVPSRSRHLPPKNNNPRPYNLPKRVYKPSPRSLLATGFIRNLFLPSYYYFFFFLPVSLLPPRHHDRVHTLAFILRSLLFFSPPIKHSKTAHVSFQPLLNTVCVFPQLPKSGLGSSFTVILRGTFSLHRPTGLW